MDGREQARIALIHEARGVLLIGHVGPFTPVPLDFAWTRTPNVPLILGQVNFFAEFDVCFWGARSAFEISPKVVEPE